DGIRDLTVTGVQTCALPIYALKRQTAPGVDCVTWQEYKTGLAERLAALHSRVQRGAYQAQPTRRVYIPKADEQPHPLNITALEEDRKSVVEGKRVGRGGGRA